MHNELCLWGRIIMWHPPFFRCPPFLELPLFQLFQDTVLAVVEQLPQMVGQPSQHRGFVGVPTSNTPTIADTKTTDGQTAGTFTSTITGLTAGVTYHVRAYATNSV